MSWLDFDMSMSSFVLLSMSTDLSLLIVNVSQSHDTDKTMSKSVVNVKTDTVSPESHFCLIVVNVFQ